MISRAAAAGLSVLAGGVALGGAGARKARAAQPPLVSADVDPGSLLTKLVRRVTMGASAEELALAAELGYDGYLEYHLNHEAIDDSAMWALPAMTALTGLGVQPDELYDWDGHILSFQLIEAVGLRAVYTKRQLFERMVEFWTDHFNIDIDRNMCRWLKLVDDREVIRFNALGRFEDLLTASATSPCMLHYLDNDTSTGEAPNENYARELMELHTISPGHYTQQDVSEVARCFTGWTWWPQGSSWATGSFRYIADWHDNGEKHVLGHTIPAGGGLEDGFAVLRILAAHPATADHLALKLCRWLLEDNPNPTVVRAVAAAFTQSGGDIKAMIRAALRPNHLADARPKFKRPMHLMASALRALPHHMNSAMSTMFRVTLAGHRPFSWLPPNGYPEEEAVWREVLLPRWNMMAELVHDHIDDVRIHFDQLYAGATTPDQMAARLADTLFFGEMPAPDRAQLAAYIAAVPGQTDRPADALGLALSLPAFQYY